LPGPELGDGNSAEWDLTTGKERCNPSREKKLVGAEQCSGRLSHWPMTMAANTVMQCVPEDCTHIADAHRWSWSHRLTPKVGTQARQGQARKSVWTPLLISLTLFFLLLFVFRFSTLFIFYLNIYLHAHRPALVPPLALPSNSSFFWVGF
jgi:hypothetical protein